jgi:hypothetical protein
MIQDSPDFQTEIIEGEQAQNQLERTVIPLIGQAFKSISVSIFKEYSTTDNLERVGFYHRDDVSVGFCLCDLERIEVASNIKNKRDKELTFVFKQGVVQLKLFCHVFRRSEYIYVRCKKYFETNCR